MEMAREGTGAEDVVAEVEAMGYPLRSGAEKAVDLGLHFPSIGYFQIVPIFFIKCCCFL